ncbi:hypothetical protein FBZ84_101207 [Azospirillum baldaniorum]|uniref:hypothetical protein n=1 Tax=Azospirillum baldaniorum TaxID=1064539 RepID=UPI0011A30AC4|nr:hypothetical protein [Azospirillum baldaniorum]TWA71940.1 hypothetical protein FBZ84_101207 [Azospirillum baldaniorum]
MTDHREALERLTRWRDCMGAKLGGSPQVPDAQFSGDVVALLSLVEKQQEALKPFAELGRQAEGMTDSIVAGIDDAEVRWSDFQRAAALSSTTGGDRG